MISGIVLLLVAGAVFLSSGVIFGIALAACGKYRKFYVVDSMGSFSEMALLLETRQILVLGLCGMCLLGLFGGALFNVGVGLVGAVAGLALPAFTVRHFRRRRIRTFNAQWMEALQAMANALKAGLTLPQAMEYIAADACPPLSLELSLTMKQVKLGVSLDEAFVDMGKRVGSEELDLTVVSANIARSLGGNMAEMFETLSSTLRERFRLEGKIEAMTAQGRLQGWIVAAMPGVLGLALNAMRPDLMGPMMNHVFGWVLAAVVLIMEGLGIALIRRIVDIDV
jgi:tight adherence protein B